MDRFFTQDNIRSRAILAAICQQLGDVQDLLELEEVNRLTLAAVRSHRHDRLVIFECSTSTLGPDYDEENAKYCETDDSVLDRLVTSSTDSPRRGPVICRLELDFRLDLSNLPLWFVKLSTSIRADHIKELALDLNEDYMYEVEDYDRFNRLVDRTLDGITFDSCNNLTIRIKNYESGDAWYEMDTYRVLPINFYSHFPTLEELHVFKPWWLKLPPLSSLPAPHHLKRLTLYGTDWDMLPLQEVNFVQLHAISIRHSVHKSSDVNLLEALMRHPPVHLQTIEMAQFSDWWTLLLKSSPSGGTSWKSLQISKLYVMNLKNFTGLKTRLHGLTHLTVSNFESHSVLSDLLRYTPNLVDLGLGRCLDPETDYDSSSSKCTKLGLCVLQHPLASLTRLTLHSGLGGIRVDWLESVMCGAPDLSEIHLKITYYETYDRYLFAKNYELLMRLTHLRILSFESEEIVLRFLHMTPSLVELELGSCGSNSAEGEAKLEDPRVRLLEGALPSLERLTLSNDYQNRPDFIQSIARLCASNMLHVRFIDDLDKWS